MPQFLKVAKQTVEKLNSSVRSRTKTVNYPTESRSLGRWRKTDEPTVRRLTQEYIPLADLHPVSLRTGEITPKLDSEGDEGRVGGCQTSVVKSIRIEEDENVR